jgi:hypothetical protein
MPLPDHIKRLINQTFLTHDWGDDIPFDFVPDANLIDEYAEVAAERCTAEIMEIIDSELSSLEGDSGAITTGERRMIRNRLLTSCRTRSRRNLEKLIENRLQDEQIEEDNLVFDFGRDEAGFSGMVENADVEDFTGDAYPSDDDVEEASR